MVTFSPESLRNIKRFDQLVAYLRDELDWPIDTEDFDDLTFDYEPEELGIDPKNAAKIEIIKQLRPLVSNQPWGIFWIKFKPKRLPVVALRRILGQLVTKKRATADKAGRPTWKLDDLMLISAIGEEDERQITFAHFADDAYNGLPTLRVLGWDDDDTLRKLDWVERQLKSHLTWPDGGTPNEWRMQWRQAFILRHREVPKTTKELVTALAELAQAIRKRANTAIALETEHGPLRKLHTAFQDSLIHDLSHDGFADMYAQTIAYGLLSARISRPAGLVAEDAALMVPRTNPFLRELMEEFLRIGGRQKDAPNGGIDFDELGVNDIVELLRKANMEAVITDFGRARPGEDPVIHFYEDFMKAYDAKQRVRRGIYYTPIPVVSFIVRSVDEILREGFGLSLGLADTTTWGEMKRRFDAGELPGAAASAASEDGAEADAELRAFTIPQGVSENDPFIQILDPAVGTGTFLVEVIDLIHKRMKEHWLAEGHMELELDKLWNDYVANHLLPRTYGYELMMAPYAICHMKVGLKLADTGYHFRSSQRLRVYLTNALEPPQDLSEMLEFVAPFLAREARAANVVKRDQRFTVVIGNPPYSGHSANTGEWIHNLLRSRLPDDAQSYFEVDGAALNERNPKWLNDDYVKFIRFGQYCISQVGVGILGMITNHGYFDNPTFRGMRQSLQRSFPEGHVVDLHGNVKKAAKDEKDENVFDIQQGVGVGLWSSSPMRESRPGIHYEERVGERINKYQWLLANNVLSVSHVNVHPVSPYYLFVPQTVSLREEFASGWSIQDVFLVSTMGVTTGRDQLCVSLTKEESLANLRDFASSLSEANLASRFGLSNKSGWNIAGARKAIRSTGVCESHCRPFCYRPMDQRILYLDTAIVGRARLDVMRHMLDGQNLAICTTRQVNGDFRHVLCVRFPANDCLVSNASGERSYLFPLYLLPEDDSLVPQQRREPNFATGFTRKITEYLNIADGRDENSARYLTPEIMFGYVYAILHSRTYRDRYAEFLRIEFPRLPFTHNLELFRMLGGFGTELVALHLMDSPALDRPLATYHGPADPDVEKVNYADGTVWLDKAKTRGFRGVPEEVWNFHIGGYQVCHKWLKDRQKKGGKNPRPGRVLTNDDIAHYHKIVVALNETIRIMAEIDKTIEAHGGWPDAFITDPEEIAKLRGK